MLVADGQYYITDILVSIIFHYLDESIFISFSVLLTCGNIGYSIQSDPICTKWRFYSLPFQGGMRWSMQSCTPLLGCYGYYPDGEFEDRVERRQPQLSTATREDLSLPCPAPIASQSINSDKRKENKILMVNPLLPWLQFSDPLSTLGEGA